MRKVRHLGGAGVRHLGDAPPPRNLLKSGHIFFYDAGDEGACQIDSEKFKRCKDRFFVAKSAALTGWGGSGREGKVCEHSFPISCHLHFVDLLESILPGVRQTVSQNWKTQRQAEPSLAEKNQNGDGPRRSSFCAGFESSAS